MANENTLDYRPSFKREERLATNWVGAQDAITPDGIRLPENPKKTTETVLKYYEMKDFLDKSIADLRLRLEKLKLPAVSAAPADIERAKLELGLPTGELTIRDFDAAWDNKKTPAGHFLLEVMEDAFEGLDGTIEMELYPDYLQLREESNLLEDYLSRFIDKIVSFESKDRQEQDWPERFAESEAKWFEEKETQFLHHEAQYIAYIKAMLGDATAITKEKESLSLQEKKQKEFSSKEILLEDSLSLLREKTGRMYGFCKELNKELTRTPFEKEGIITKTLLDATENESEWQENLTNVELMLTLSVDVSNKEKRHLKNSVRHVYSSENRLALLQQLNIYTDTYLHTGMSLLHLANFYDAEQPKEATLLLDEISNGLVELNEQKKKKAKDFYTITHATSDLMAEQLEKTLKKDNARQGYHLIRKIESLSETKGMPETAKLDLFLES